LSPDPIRQLQLIGAFETERAMFEYKMDHIMSYNATVAEPEIIGEVPEGLRANFYVTGGTISGPKVIGKFRPAGGDWLLLRRDGVAILDIKATAETNDGALLYFSAGGIIDLGPDGYHDFLNGVPPASGAAIRISPRVWTSHPSYIWLNRLFLVGIGGVFLERSEVAYDIYAVV
jgi:hypothetical protein